MRTPMAHRAKFCPMNTTSRVCRLWQTIARQMEVRQYVNPLLIRSAMLTCPSVRSVLHLETTRPNLISMLAGKPHSSTFPISSLSFTYRDPLNPGQDVPIQLTEQELAVGLQYGPTTGHQELIDWLYGLQKFAHGRDNDGTWSLTIGNGAQDLIYKVNTQYLLVCGVSRVS